MLRSVYLVGIVLLAAGFVLLGLGLIPNGKSTTVAIPAGSSVPLAASTLTPQTLSVSWTGETVGTRIYLIVGTPTCSSPKGLVARGTGGNGSISATLHPGTTYLLYGCGVTTFKTVTVNYTAKGGIGWDVILGAVTVGFGLLFVLVGARKWGHEELLHEGSSSPHPSQVDPVASAAALRSSIERSRGDFIQPATPANQLRPLPSQTCPSCGRVYSSRKYRTCPECSTALGPPSTTSR